MSGNLKRIREWVKENRSYIERTYKDLEPSFSIDDEPVDLIKIPDRSLHVDLSKCRNNGAGHNILVKKIDNLTLVDMVYKNLENIISIRRDRTITYEESLVNLLVPELLDRLEDLEKENMELKSRFEADVEHIVVPDDLLSRVKDLRDNPITRNNRNNMKTAHFEVNRLSDIPKVSKLNGLNLHEYSLNNSLSRGKLEDLDSEGV